MAINKTKFRRNTQTKRDFALNLGQDILYGR